MHEQCKLWIARELVIGRFTSSRSCVGACAARRQGGKYLILEATLSLPWLLLNGMTDRFVQASSPEERAVAIEAAAQGILETLQWRQKRKFMTPQQLHPWDQLVSPSSPPVCKRRATSKPSPPFVCVILSLLLRESRVKGKHCNA